MNKNNSKKGGKALIFFRDLTNFGLKIGIFEAEEKGLKSLKKPIFRTEKPTFRPEKPKY